MKRSFSRKLIKFSNYSMCLTLPKQATEELGWNPGQEVAIKLDIKRGRLIITSLNPVSAKANVPDPVVLEMADDRPQPAKPIVTKAESDALNGSKSSKKSEDDDLMPLEEL